MIPVPSGARVRETACSPITVTTRKPGRELHDIGQDGNLILQKIFTAARSGVEGSRQVPPTLIFSGSGTWRDGAT